MRTTLLSPNRPTDLSEDLVNEINRVRELLNFYKSLPDNTGVLAAQRLNVHLSHAEKALHENDIMQMLNMYGVLKECQ